MVQQTSKDAYFEIRDNGLLSQRRWEVYDFVYHYGPTTIRKTWKALGPHLTTGTYSTRFSELKNMGVLQEVGTEYDTETGMTVILWNVTDGLPIKIERSEPEYRYICDLCNRSFNENVGAHRVIQVIPGTLCLGPITKWRKVK